MVLPTIVECLPSAEHVWRFVRVVGSNVITIRCDNCKKELDTTTNWMEWRGWYGSNPKET